MQEFGTVFVRINSCILAVSTKRVVKNKKKIKKIVNKLDIIRIKMYLCNPQTGTYYKLLKIYHYD